MIINGILFMQREWSFFNLFSYLCLTYILQNAMHFQLTVSIPKKMSTNRLSSDRYVYFLSAQFFLVFIIFVCITKINGHTLKLGELFNDIKEICFLSLKCKHAVL